MLYVGWDWASRVHAVGQCTCSDGGTVAYQRDTRPTPRPKPSGRSSIPTSSSRKGAGPRTRPPRWQVAADAADARGRKAERRRDRGPGAPRCAIALIRALRVSRSVEAPAAIIAWRTASWDTPSWAAFLRRLAGG